MVKINITDDEAYRLVGVLIFVMRFEKDNELSTNIKSLADKISKQHLEYMKKEASP